jgi:outer membrane translocation and assembly module TamA
MYSFFNLLVYDTNLGFRLSAEYKNRYLNKYGHQFNAHLNLSLKKSNFIMEYVLPYNNPLKNRLSFFTAITYENTTNILQLVYANISIAPLYNTQNYPIIDMIRLSFLGHKLP